MHLEILNDNIINICSFKNALETLSMIDAAELSASSAQQTWIYNEKNL